jgi:hypothetical protein
MTARRKRKSENMRTALMQAADGDDGGSAMAKPRTDPSNSWWLGRKWQKGREI